MDPQALTVRAFAIADQNMLDIVLTCTCMVDGNARMRRPDYREITTNGRHIEMLEDIMDALVWLDVRGLAKIIQDDPLRVLIAEHIEI